MSRDLLVRTALLAGAAFLTCMAGLLRYYVYPGALVLPLDQRQTYHLAASAATYLDTASLEVHAGVPVVNTVSLYGDARAGDDRTAVWVEFASLETENGRRIDYHERRTAFDRRTGMAVDCCEDYIDADTEVAVDFTVLEAARENLEWCGISLHTNLIRKEPSSWFAGGPL